MLATSSSLPSFTVITAYLPAPFLTTSLPLFLTTYLPLFLSTYLPPFLTTILYLPLLLTTFTTYLTPFPGSFSFSLPERFPCFPPDNLSPSLPDSLPFSLPDNLSPSLPYYCTYISPSLPDNLSLPPFLQLIFLPS